MWFISLISKENYKFLLISTIKIFYPNDNLVVKIQFSHWDSGEIRKE